MKIIVFGAGALGSLFGGLLSKRNEVLLVGRQSHIKRIEEGGLAIEGITNDTFYPNTIWDGSKYDIVLLTTKAYDTKKAVMNILNKFGKIPVLSLQNGLKNEEIIANILDNKNVIGGVTNHGATFIEDGRIYHAGKGTTIIGSLHENNQFTKNIALMFKACNIDTKISNNIKKEIWKKTIINAAINGLTSILKCKNGSLLTNTNTEELLEIICKEGIRVAKAEKMNIDERIISQTKTVAENTSENISSMLQDILKNKKTEVEEIHGALVHVANAHNISLPVCEFLSKAIKVMKNVRHLGCPNDHLISRRGP
jgi:2-dehydropantoate 2-reductase